MGGCCGLVHGYTSKVIDVTEDGSHPVEFPCDEAGDILAVSCCPAKIKRETYVSVVGPFDAEANQGPISMIQGKLPVGLSHVH